MGLRTGVFGSRAFEGLKVSSSSSYDDDTPWETSVVPVSVRWEGTGFGSESGYEVRFTWPTYLRTTDDDDDDDDDDDGRSAPSPYPFSLSASHDGIRALTTPVPFPLYV